MDSIYQFLTVREICEWWGVPNTTAARHVLQSLEDGNGAIRRSGKTLIIHISWPLERYGSPANERPNYND